MSVKPTVAIIVAQSSNRVIGIENRLPWHLPEDLKYFKARTLGKPIIMGRKTYESIGRPLPGRRNIVITRQPDWSAEGVDVADSLSDAVLLAQQVAQEEGAPEVMVIGGAQIYQEALPLADTLYVTDVAIELQGDAFFPEISPERWQEVECSEAYPAELQGAAIDYRFLTYSRR